MATKESLPWALCWWLDVSGAQEHVRWQQSAARVAWYRAHPLDVVRIIRQVRLGDPEAA